MKGSAVICSALLASVIAAIGCTDALAAAVGKQPVARNYLELRASGKLPVVPYVWERKKGTKHIVVIGTRHSRDPHSPMYDRIETLFKQLQPQLVLHESSAPADLGTMPRDQAIERAADLGFAVYLADRYHVPVRSGDAPVKEEFKALLAHHAAEDVFVFLTAQRLIGSERNPDLKTAAAEYPGFFKDYLIGNGLPQHEGWEEWKGFLREYRRVVGRPLSKTSWNPDLVSPILNSGRLSQIARTSDALRDRYLLTSIQKALGDHDRIVVIFGGWHVLALEPELDEVLKD